MKTDIAPATGDAGKQSPRATIERAVDLLRAGEVVALPTETVYGLAADALRPEAVVKIFEVKERPRFDPLIVHLPDIAWVERVADVSTPDEEIIASLTKVFWPGPFTMVLPKTSIIPDIVTAGLDTVAVRIGAHPALQEVIRTFGKPLAAPSANRFGRISPTTAAHVIDELGGRIPLIVNGGPTTHGIESTVVAVRNGTIEILRPGPITEEMICGIGFQPMPADATTTHRSPGQLPSHYAPRTPLRLTADLVTLVTGENQRIGLLAWNRVEPSKFAAVRELSQTQDLREAAANLFRYLRELDDAKLDLIVAELVPNKDLGIAINDRLRRAAQQ